MNRYGVLWAAAAAGVAMHLTGIGVDAFMHSRDANLAAEEGIFTLSNPGHLLIFLGFGLTAAAVMGIAMTWMHERGFGGNGAAGNAVRTFSLPVMALAAAGSISVLALGEQSGGHTHSHTVHTHDGHYPPDRLESMVLALGGNLPNVHDHAHPAAVTANASSDPMGDDNKHTHGHEVGVSPAELLAAAEFYAAVKSETAKYADLRDALAAGYIQITQDLPGIAAHFVHLGYNSDGDLMNPAKPEILLYTKRMDGEWRLVGAMFSSERASETPPSFFGDLDVWHRHTNLCFQAGGVVSTRANAAACPGIFQAVGAWNLHVWTAPGATGVFAHDFEPISPGAFPPASGPAAAELVRRVP